MKNLNFKQPNDIGTLVVPHRSHYTNLLLQIREKLGRQFRALQSCGSGDDDKAYILQLMEYTHVAYLSWPRHAPSQHVPPYKRLHRLPRQFCLCLKATGVTEATGAPSVRRVITCHHITTHSVTPTTGSHVGNRTPSSGRQGSLKTRTLLHHWRAVNCGRSNSRTFPN